MGSLGDQPLSGDKLASPEDTLFFWPSMKPRWLTEAPIYRMSHRASELCLQVLKHDDWVRTCVFSPDGRLLVTGTDDQLVRVWDVDTGALQHVFDALDSYVYSVVTSQSGPHGRPLLAACGSEVIMVWDLLTGRLIERVSGINQGVEEPEPRTTEKSVRFENGYGDLHDGTDEYQTTEEDQGSIQGSGPSSEVSTFMVESIDISPQGDCLVAVSGRNIILWDIPSFKVTRVYEHQSSERPDNDEVSKSFKKVRFSPDGRLIAASIGTSIEIQDLSSDDEHYTLLDGTSNVPAHSGNIDGLCFSPQLQDDRPVFLASCSDNKITCIWNIIDCKVEAVLEYRSDYVTSVSFSSDGTLLAVASANADIAIWKQKSGSWRNSARTYPDQVLSGHTSMLWSVAFAPRGNFLASAGNDGEVRIWEVMTLEQAEQPKVDDEVEVDTGGASGYARKGHSSPVACIAVSPDGKTIASGCNRGQICFWDGLTGAWRRTMEYGHGSVVISLAFSDDGETLISTSVDDTAIVWSVNGESKERKLHLIGHDDWVRGAAISSDGNLAATASDDWNVLLWDISSYTSLSSGYDSVHPIATFSGHRDYVYSVAFSPDSRQLASVGDDSRVIIFDTSVREGHELIKTVMSDEESGSHLWRGVVFTPDSNFVLTVSVLGEVAIWKPDASEGNHCLAIYKAATPFTTMRIDKKRPDALFTDSGIWIFETQALRRNGSTDGASDQDPVQLTRPVDSCIGINGANTCITWKGDKLIPLPIDFRPDRHSSRWAQGRCVVIGCESGQVILFRVSEDCNP
jgi:WD40 repeat protein